MAWFIKREEFLWPRQSLHPHLEAHRAWVHALRQEGVQISSGYLVDREDRPGGGGLLLLEAENYETALALIERDPMVRSGGVSWQLHRWVPVVGTLGLGTEG